MKNKNIIFIGADHRGFDLKAKIIAFLGGKGHDVIDVGTYEPEAACDYPALSLEVGQSVAAHKGSLGILVCLTGIGHSIAANKVPGIFAALCYNKEAAALSRQHNNANVLVLGSKFVAEKEMMGIIETWLAAEFEGGRHLRRVKQIQKIEKKFTNETA